ncbi:MAG: hypothetical protein KA275_02995 [Chitinophagaceae bacterium]|nr:hypothetical protein [Chitinophagaceae bacterium]
MQLTYEVWNNQKSNWLIAFYGFGQQANVFDELQNMCKEKFNILVIGSPKDGERIKLEHFAFEMKKVLEKFQINMFSVLGYSLGARILLSIIPFFSKQLNQVFLVAPDGIKIHFLYGITTKTWFGKSLFKLYVNHGGILNSFYKILYQIGIFSKAFSLFCIWYCRNKDVRQRVFNSWICLTDFIPDLKQLHKIFIENNIEVFSYWGKNDAIIHEKIKHKFSEIFLGAEIFTLNEGHELLNKNLFSLIKNKLFA